MDSHEKQLVDRVDVSLVGLQHKPTVESRDAGGFLRETYCRTCNQTLWRADSGWTDASCEACSGSEDG
jgi:hypothetical protein